MRAMIAGLALAGAQFGSAAAQGQHHVDGYFRRDGTYVQPHYQTNPDSNPYNNWSTRGNVNPYTGQPGYKDPNANYGHGYGQPSYSQPSYQQPSYSEPRRPSSQPAYVYTPDEEAECSGDEC